MAVLMSLVAETQNKVIAQATGGHEWVDMGLSVKWATCNVGANAPEDYGDYFAWGDVKGQTWNGSWSEGGFSEPLGFAALRRRYELSDHKLTPEYDAAHVNLGDKWRMPTAK